MLPVVWLSLCGALGPAEAASSTPIASQTSGPAHGVVRSIDKMAMVVDMADGAKLTVQLVPGWSVTLVRTATLADIAPGSEISVFETLQPDGSSSPIEIHVYGTGMPLSPHGQWRDQAGTYTETTGQTATAANTVAGLDLDLSFPGAKSHLTVPPSTPVLTFDPAATDQVTAGTPISLFIGKGPDGALYASGVAIGEKGAPPPD